VTELCLTLKHTPAQMVDVSALTPDLLAGKGREDILRIELPPDDRLGKFLLEQNELPLGAPEDGLLSIVPSAGGASALDHP